VSKSAAAKPAKGTRRRVKASAEHRVELLFEIGCEEIPAGMLPRAAEDLKGILEKLLVAENLEDGATVETFSTPRRLVARIGGLRLRQADLSKEVTGPPKSVAFDNVGAPTRAAQSFAEKQGVPLSEIYLVSTPRGEYLAAKQVKAGRATAQVLEELLPRAIHDLSWPRTMTWTGREGARFIRPVRWIVALLDGRVLNLQFGGVTAGAVTRGHRLLGGAAIRVKNFADYEAKLKRSGVIVRAETRREKIKKELDALARRGGVHVHADASLLEQVTYLNEFPTVIEGGFDQEFLNLPDEILITVMRDHQKYFAVEKRGGELAPRFLAVINLEKDAHGLVRAGHERVLRARFADARFFWESDQKCRLADYLPRLDRVTYESRLGSYRDKVERTRALARWLAEQWFNGGILQAHVSEADRAAELAKCDLATEMVREFPELQGVVGGLYARAQGEPDEVADAVYDHYRPAGMDDEVPRNLTGCAVALADKLDAITGCFTVGAIPTGSSDPYALRRAALGIVKIVLEKKLPASLSLAVAAAAKGLLTHPPKRGATPAQEAQVVEFLLERARFVFRERDGFGYDEVNAVFRAGADDLADARKRLEAVRGIRKSRNFEPLAVSFKRVRNILEKSAAGDGASRTVDAALFENDAEHQLFKAMREASPKVEAEKRGGKYREALERIAALRPHVDRFFADVMVMAEKEDVRRNRLALLGELLREFSTIADFAEIGGEAK
jgi:glycyl-tRNA synthetase beta chain